MTVTVTLEDGTAADCFNRIFDFPISVISTMTTVNSLLDTEESQLGLYITSTHIGVYTTSKGDMTILCI